MSPETPAHEAGRPLVSIVIPTRNEERSIESCLAALAAQTYAPGRLEIIVVDALSEDGTAGIVEAHAASRPNVRMIRNPDRITPAGFNAGIRAARGSVIGVMSGHGAPARDYVERAVNALAATGAWCVGGRIDRRAEDATTSAIAAVTSSPFGVGNAEHNYATTARWVETAFPGLWPRWVFSKVGLFDPELVRNQDDELAYRIRVAGGGVWYDPRLVIGYRVRSSLRRLFSQYRQYGMWKVRVFQKHPRAARARHLIPASWVGAVGAGAAILPFHPIGAWLLGLTLVPYGIVMGFASTRLARGGVSPVRAFVTFATLHTAYGIGFVQGLIRFAPRWFRDREGRIERLDQPVPG